MLSFCLQLRPRASQLQSPFLAISHTVDVILLNIANVFEIRSALAGFKEIAVGLESFSFCSVEEREGERERESSTPTGLVWNTNMAAVSLFWNTSMTDMTSCENAILNWREITFRILDFSSLSFAGELYKADTYFRVRLLTVFVAQGSTPYYGLYVEAPPERGTFFRLQVYERIGASLVSV